MSKEYLYLLERINLITLKLLIVDIDVINYYFINEFGTKEIIFQYDFQYNSIYIPYKYLVFITSEWEIFQRNLKDIKTVTTTEKFEIMNFVNKKFGLKAKKFRGYQRF